MSLSSDLVQAIEEIDSLQLAAQEEPNEVNLEFCNAATEKSIIVLDEVYDSREFRSAVESLHAFRKKHVREHQRTIKSEEAFRRFLDSEQQILLEAQLSPSLTNSFIEECALLRWEVLHANIPPEEVYKCLYVIRVKLQIVKPDLEPANALKGHKKWDWRKIIKSGIWSLGGAALIVLDELALRATTGLAGAGATLSAIFGELFIDRAATQVVEQVGPG